MKRIIVLILAIILIISIMPITTLAATHSTIVKGYYYIKHVGSGRYLDIDDGRLYENGTQLQIWDKWFAHQNQVYFLRDTGQGWKIQSIASGKIIEVRDSSHDDYAQVAQWDDNGQTCGRWDIVYNQDGTISFKNRESGKYLNVHGNNTTNGSKIIQYHPDGTTAEKFELQLLYNEDILNAKWTRTIDNSEIEWATNGGPSSYILNWTWWTNENLNYYPTPGKKYIMSVEYLAPQTVAQMVHARAKAPELWDDIGKAVGGELSESAISSLLDLLGIKDIPFIGYGIGILEVLWNSKENSDWNKFLDTVSYDSNGRCSGIIVYSYYTIVSNRVYRPAHNGTGAYVWWQEIKGVEELEYKQWTGDNFGSVQYDPKGKNGSWVLNFK